MQWWCSAQTAPWSWSWQPYPGVWLFVVLLATHFVVARRAARDSAGREGGTPEGTGREGTGRDGTGRPFLFGTGLLVLWASLDWPLGPLAAGYLASAHMVQMLLVSLVAPVLMLAGFPKGPLRRACSGGRGGAILRVATHPLGALLLFNTVVLVTHVPRVLDGLSATQGGMLAMDLLWLGAGLLFWWPLVVREPERAWFGPFLQIGYLFVNTIPVILPYGFLLFADFPIYATYELAPPFPGLTSVTDQQIAGLVMKLGGGLILWTAITVRFFRWYLEEEAASARPARDAA